MKSGASTGEGANARKCTNNRDKKRERGADDDGAPRDEECAENVRAEERMGSGENEKKKKKKKKEDLEEEFTKTFNVERAEGKKRTGSSLAENIVAARNDRKATSDSSLNTEKVNFLSNASTPSSRSPTNSAVDKDEKEKPAPKANTKKVRAKTTSRLAEAVALSKKDGVKKKSNKKKNANARALPTAPSGFSVERKALHASARSGDRFHAQNTNVAESTIKLRSIIVKTKYLQPGFMETDEYTNRYNLQPFGSADHRMVLKFTDLYDLNPLIGKEFGAEEEIREKALRDYNKRTRLNIRGPPCGYMGSDRWLVISGNKKDVVKHCFDLISKKVLELEENASLSFGEANKGSGVDEEEEELDEYENGIIVNRDDVDRDELLIQAKLEKELLGDIVGAYDYGSDDEEEEEEEEEDDEEEENKVKVKKKVDNALESSVSVEWSDDDEDKGIDKPDVAEENSCQKLNRPSKKKKKNEISILDYIEEEIKCPNFTEKFFGDANRGGEVETMKMTERLERLCVDKKEEFIAHIEKDVMSDRAENGAKNIAFGTIRDVTLGMRTKVTDTFARGFGILSEKDRERVVDKVDAKVTHQFGDVVGDINFACASNAAVSRTNIENIKMEENFISDPVEISKVLQDLSVEFDGTYGDPRVEEATQAFKREYRRISKRGGPPACATGNVFCIIYGPAEEVFKEVQPFETVRMDTGVYNVMPLNVLIEQLSNAFEKAGQKGKKILLQRILDCSTYPVATIAEETNDAEIQKFLKDFAQYENQNSKGKTFAIPLRPDFSIFKERLEISKCLENPVADHAKCLKKWLQHTVKNMEEVGRESFMATLTPKEQKESVIIELHVDLTRCRAPGSHDFEELIKKYTKREIRLNLKRSMDFATKFLFKLVISSRWVFKRFVKYLRNAESTIGREYAAAADGEVTDLLDGESIGLCVAAAAAEGDAAGGTVLASTLEAARGRIFHVAAVEKTVANEQERKRLEVYNHYHLSQALRSGGNTNLFAIAVVKLIAGYGLSLPDAIQLARSTYYFNNLLARSVVLRFIQEVKMNDEDLRKTDRLEHYDVNFFVNPDTFRGLVCILHSHLPQANGVLVDASNDAEQFKAWKTFIKEGPDARAVMMTHWNCTLSRFLGIFASAMFECFKNKSLDGGDGKFNNQYDFRDLESIASLVWRKNVIFALRDHFNERTLTGFSDDNKIEDERLREKLKLVKYAATKKKTNTNQQDGKKIAQQHPKFPLRDVDQKKKRTTTCVVCKRMNESGRFRRVPQDCPNEVYRGGSCHQECYTKAMRARCAVCQQTIESGRLRRFPQNFPTKEYRGEPCHESCYTGVIGATCVLCEKTIKAGRIRCVPQDYWNTALRGKPCHRYCRIKKANGAY